MTENRLAQETSLYLLQHKDNPVHWRPWGPAALEEARQANKPILLSVGYAACHWCHVMAHESFEDDEVAQVMNRHFVNIKVDREERPDIDTIYMSALHMLGEHGGWPLTMFLTPNGEPFWGGTYFPKTPRFGKPGFVQILQEVSRIFQEEPDKIEQNRAALLERLRDGADAATGDTLAPGLLDAAAERLLSVADPDQGGIKGAPKFPQTAFLELLWRAGERGRRDTYQAPVLRGLNRMSMGGIYDHLGGGFARYSVDARWLVPHFEKMLYDNALLIDMLTLAWRATGSELFKTRVGETVGWLQREMLTPEGGFASSLDADSEGEEGKFYVWTADEIRALLGDDDYGFFAGHYDVSAAGNWEGKTILNRSARQDLAGPEEEARLGTLREKLLSAREGRVRPGLDDKVLADWNGLAIHALSHAGFTFDRPEWVALARKAFEFVAGSMADGARLLHSYRTGRATHKGLLCDYAYMIRAALALHQESGESHYLDRARAWTATLEQHFPSPNGAYFMAPDDSDDLIVRPMSGHDDATPNGNAVSAANHVRLWHLTGETAYRNRAEAIFSAFAADVKRNVFGFCALLNAYDLALRPTELVLVAPDGAEGAADLIGVVRRALPINLIAAQISDTQALPPGHPASGKAAVDGKATAFVCRSGACSLPLTAAEELSRALAEKPA
ncbi:MAG TPA: thioredoxin domain-containing protein [Hyphomicrobiales bacterium]|nr:thioredoxin domain-containing protein [Hyphomicrobiales bacterium]